MRYYSLFLASALSVFTSVASADALGIYVGGGMWNHDPDGSFGTVSDPNNINVGTDLGYSSESDTYFYAAFEHFVPLLPNLRVERSTLEQVGSATSLTFNGQPVSGKSLTSLDTTDAIAYWRLLDNWVNFDIGLNVRQLDADFNIDDQTLSVSETVPMLYLAAQFDLPFTGLSVGADINHISASGVTYRDMRLRALYETGVIGFEAGIKTTTIELDDVDDVNADLEFTGLMVGAFLHF